MCILTPSQMETATGRIGETGQRSDLERFRQPRRSPSLRGVRDHGLLALQAHFQVRRVTTQVSQKVDFLPQTLKPIQHRKLLGMDVQYRVRRVLSPAQYGDILLCEMLGGAMTNNQSDDDDSIPENPRDAEQNNQGGVLLVVVKHISWSCVERKRLDLDATSLQLSDDPMLELDVAAKICAAGSHKHVVQYLKVLRGDRGSFGIVMEYCNEGDLLKRLEQLPDNRVSEGEALLVLGQIADGLHFLHEVVGVAHLDVSLENVLVQDGVCKLGDFGLSTRISETSRLVEGRVGKLGYMAPEVAADTEYDPTLADIWSLGVLFFILLTGSPLVEMASVECPVFRAFCRLGLRSVLEDWKMLSNFNVETVSLCERMLQVHPGDRISLHDVLEHPAFRTVSRT